LVAPEIRGAGDPSPAEERRLRDDAFDERSEV
jgi:hypothetical protein